MNTVRVRIAVAVDPSGHWSAQGRDDWTDEFALGKAIRILEHGEATYYVEADLPIPEIQTVNGEVKEA